MEIKEVQNTNLTAEEILKGVPEDFIKERIDPNRDKADILEDISEEQADCIMLDLLYLENFDRKPEDNNIDLYPDGWFENPDYKKQFEILVEAVVEEKKIVDTKKYNELRKGKYTR